MSEQSAAPTAAAPPGSVHELLRQLVESHFVLTDRDGAVTRWSAPAQSLFGWEPPSMLGQPMLETLGISVSPPRHGGRLTANARLRDGRDVEVELVFIPVRMSQSLEFNGFLSALEQMSAAALSVERLRSGHYGVVDWIEASMNGEGTLADDELAAGTIVTFRPTTPVELFDDDQDDERYEEFDDFDDIERALAGTATSVEEARTDAAAARSEAAVASERVGTLEVQGERLREELEQTRALVQALQGELANGRGTTAEETNALVESLREELQQARGQALDESRALVEALRAELAQAPGVSAEEAAALVESLRGELNDLRKQQLDQDTVNELREGLEKVRKRVRQATDQDFGAQIEAIRSELSVLKANSTEDASRDSEALESLIAEVEQQAKDARKAAGRVEEAAARAGAHAQTAAAVGQQLDEKVAQVDAVASSLQEGEQHAIRAEQAAAGVAATAAQAEQAAKRADEVAAGVGTTAAAIEAATKRAEEAAASAAQQLEEAAARAEQAAAAAERHLEEAREAAEQAAVEAEVARVQAEAVQTRPRRRLRANAGATPANGGADLHAPLFGREEDKGPERELRAGFDDAAEPMATIALDGHFRELNKPFSELVGYKEKDFAACTWPPVMDRANLPKHREQMRALVAGEMESVEVNTGYVHAQGLLVPVVGTLSLRRTDGTPDHFLLELVRR